MRDRTTSVFFIIGFPVSFTVYGIAHIKRKKKGQKKKGRKGEREGRERGKKREREEGEKEERKLVEED